jgi:hypothetical protein
MRENPFSNSRVPGCYERGNPILRGKGPAAAEVMLSSTPWVLDFVPAALRITFRHRGDVAEWLKAAVC